MALCDTVKLLMALINIADDLLIPQPLPLTIWSDSQSAIQIATNPVSSHRTRHINLRHHFIREQVLAKRIIARYISTVDMLADLLTKGTGRATFELLRDLILTLVLNLLE
jgi:hypothetical protein